MVIAEEKVELRKYFKRAAVTIDRRAGCFRQPADCPSDTGLVMHIAKRTASWAIWLLAMSCL